MSWCTIVTSQSMLALSELSVMIATAAASAAPVLNLFSKNHISVTTIPRKLAMVSKVAQ